MINHGIFRAIPIDSTQVHFPAICTLATKGSPWIFLLAVPGLLLSKLTCLSNKTEPYTNRNCNWSFLYKGSHPQMLHHKERCKQCKCKWLRLSSLEATQVQKVLTSTFPRINGRYLFSGSFSQPHAIASAQ